jgi:hypothetical protein
MMKLKIFTMAGAALIALSSFGIAGDIYRINHPNSLITANYDDLATFMSLNARGRSSEVRSLYNYLNLQGALFNLQPGDNVNVVAYYNRSNIAEISWGDGRYTGYINQDDLSHYLGSN